MYTPDIFALTDPVEVGRILREYSFALLVTAAGGTPMASHLPFLFDPERGPKGTLFCHMARANPQWKDFAKLGAAGREALVVFQGPHGYVSPNWYAGGPAVPTWNYLAVHAYGSPRIIDDAAGAKAHQERLVDTHEAGFAAPWSMASQPDNYIARMLRGIVAFEIPISRLEAKAKLNQNKSEADRRGVITALEASDRPGDLELAAVMRRAAED
jgi:transcriptional regulator